MTNSYKDVWNNVERQRRTRDPRFPSGCPIWYLRKGIEVRESWTDEVGDCSPPSNESWYGVRVAIGFSILCCFVISYGGLGMGKKCLRCKN